MGIAEQFSPGELVRARGREWVVVDSSSALTLRPLSGSEADLETIIPELEADPVTYASFEPLRSQPRRGDVMPLSYSGMHSDCPYAVERVRFVLLVALTLNREPISLPP